MKTPEERHEELVKLMEINNKLLKVIAVMAIDNSSHSPDDKSELAKNVAEV